MHFKFCLMVRLVKNKDKNSDDDGNLLFVLDVV
jgi:hypothetical protein